MIVTAPEPARSFACAAERIEPVGADLSASRDCDVMKTAETRTSTAASRPRAVKQPLVDSTERGDCRHILEAIYTVLEAVTDSWCVVTFSAASTSVPDMKLGNSACRGKSYPRYVRVTLDVAAMTRI